MCTLLSSENRPSWSGISAYIDVPVEKVYTGLSVRT